MTTTPVFVKTLGCKVNSFDSAALTQRFQAHGGFQIVDNSEAAQLIVVNSCSVTSNSEREARYLARLYKRQNPHSFLTLTGCYAQTNSAQLADLDEVDFIVPNEVKNDLVDLVSEAFLKKSQDGFLNEKLPLSVSPVRDNRQSHFKASLTLFDAASSSKTRAFVKIQDGCNGFCSYCLIPYARGASISVPMERVFAEVQRLADLDTKEIVFTGIHIGDYGRDLAELSHHQHPIVELLKRVLDQTNLPRLRISSLEPSELSRELLELMSENRDRFCDHLHLPLQAGCDRILKLMRRTYDTAEYADTVAMARSYFPRANFGADVIPGFPSETEEEFADTLAFIERVGLNTLHVFPYSQRPNTAAIKLKPQIDGAEIKRRAKILRDLSARLERKYYEDFLGSTAQVLWENSVDDSDRRRGHSQNYLNVVAGKNLNCVPGTISQVVLRGFTGANTLLAT